MSRCRLVDITWLVELDVLCLWSSNVQCLRCSWFVQCLVLSNVQCLVLDVLSTRNELYYIRGDFNINTAQNQTSGISKKFLYTLISYGAIPLITKASRVKDRSSTIIDHIITNDTKHRIKPGVFETCNVSDHYPIFCQIDKPALKRTSLLLSW